MKIHNHHVHTADALIGNQLDIIGPEHGVQVEVDHGRAVLYVHVDGLTVLRISNIPGRVDVVEHEKTEGPSSIVHSQR